MVPTAQTTFLTMHNHKGVTKEGLPTGLCIPCYHKLVSEGTWDMFHPLAVEDLGTDSLGAAALEMRRR